LSLLELTATLGIKVVYERAHWELVNEVKAIRKKKKKCQKAIQKKTKQLVAGLVREETRRFT